MTNTDLPKKKEGEEDGEEEEEVKVCIGAFLLCDQLQCRPYLSHWITSMVEYNDTGYESGR